MLEPRGTDIPLILIFIALPLVTYFILGKWSDTSKRKETLSSIEASGASEEALQVDNMAIGTIMPVVNLPISGIHQCARCFAPAGTRCSQCKSVWYWYANFLTVTTSRSFQKKL